MQEYTVKVDNNGNKLWYQNDKLTRLDGPAIEWSNGHKAWYIEGKKLTEEEFNNRNNKVEVTLEDIVKAMNIDIDKTASDEVNGRMKRLVRSIITYIEESEVTTAGEYGGGEEWAEIKKGVADSNLFFDRHKEGVELHAEAEWAIEKIKENANAQCPVTEGEPSCLPLSAEVGCNDLIDQKIGDLEFKEVIMNRDCRGYEDFQWAHHAEWGSITILDRMTGFGFRDVETGFRDPDGRFWLASGNFSIKAYPELTVKEAIEKIKENANTCCG